LTPPGKVVEKALRAGAPGARKDLFLGWCPPAHPKVDPFWGLAPPGKVAETALRSGAPSTVRDPFLDWRPPARLPEKAFPISKPGPCCRRFFAEEQALLVFSWGTVRFFTIAKRPRNPGAKQEEKDESHAQQSGCQGMWVN